MGGIRFSLSFPKKKKKKNFNSNVNTFSISNAFQILIWYTYKYTLNIFTETKHFVEAKHFEITPTFVSSFTKFIRFFNIKNIYKIESEFNFHKILYIK